MQDRTARARGLVIATIVALAFGCAPGSVRRSASVLDYLYPEGRVAASAEEIHLQLPLRVGIAFAPGGSHSASGGGIQNVTESSLEDAFSEPQQRELLKRVAGAFQGTPDVSLVEILPTHNMKSSGGFENLQPLAAMYGLNLVALVSYDQIQFDDQDASSLLYWTIFGAYLIPADVHETRTLLDASVFDVASRALLFTGSGSSIVKGRSSANAVRRDLRAKSLEGFEKAIDDLIANLGVSLGVFRENAKRGTLRGLGTPGVQIHRDEVQSAAAGAGAIGFSDLGGIALLALAAVMAVRARADALRVPWVTLAFAAAALVVSFGPASASLQAGLQLERAAFLRGELWRVLTAPLVHGWPQLAVFDLGALVILGAWAEQRSRLRLALALFLASLLSGFAVLAWRADLAFYQGSSALASALFVICAARVLAPGSAAFDRGVAALALVGFAVKVGLEASGVSTSPVFAGTMAIESVAVAHAAGALAGALVACAERLGVVGAAGLEPATPSV